MYEVVSAIILIVKSVFALLKNIGVLVDYFYNIFFIWEVIMFFVGCAF